MSRRKVVLIIVEGPSDNTALSNLFNFYFKAEEVSIFILHKDLTIERNVNPSNIVKKIYEIVKYHAAVNYFKMTDYQKIIHVVDTDGAFIDNKYIIQDNSINKIQYSETEIRTPDKEFIEARNQQKSANLLSLSKETKVGKIPYQIYYMSCNLDHVLYNKLNTTDEEKAFNSRSFSRRYKNKIPDAISFISNSDFSVKGNYPETWKYIATDLHSLERNTNLGLCFQSNKSESDKSN